MRQRAPHPHPGAWAAAREELPRGLRQLAAGLALGDFRCFARSCSTRKVHAPGSKQVNRTEPRADPSGFGTNARDEPGASASEPASPLKFVEPFPGPRRVFITHESRKILLVLLWRNTISSSPCESPSLARLRHLDLAVHPRCWALSQAVLGGSRCSPPWWRPKPGVRRKSSEQYSCHTRTTAVIMGISSSLATLTWCEAMLNVTA
ncbi:uncharacterized protein LOC130681777 [Manis pentadactyla]|uniref:uncharacterized protein LOC130681777 n=1 Tax=Manis pentadactyla TaxID=143292 RepID=UPI00255C6829|nr:uncharacterized protein LOC130681777 [Manis pentadactyla]